MTPGHECDDSRPCPVPPNPDLLARLRYEPNALTAPSITTQVPGRPSFSARTGTRTGLNDGCIFPESYFETAVSASRLSRAALDRTPLRGAIRAAVVLVDFPDKKMGANTPQYFKDLFFSTGRIDTGSVTEYYNEVSGGKISLSGEVVGPLRMPHKLSAYAHGDSGMTDATPNAQTMAADALDALKGQVNFAPYDNDQNGYVDAFVVVHAGQGAEETGRKDDVWSLKWTLPAVTNVDGVNIFAFLTIPEDAKVGVAAHELGHLVFGWPDLYDIDSSSEGAGNWCLMAGGSWGGSPPGVKPCHPSAWCKVTQGWVDEVVDTHPQSITLGAVEDKLQVHRLWKNGDHASQEYFLLENREPVGFDQSLPGFGLLVWHIDDSQDDNHDERHYKVGLMQADALNQLATRAGRGDPGDPFPGSTGNKSFTFISNPSSRSYAGQDSKVSIMNISAPAPTMTMDIAV
ncbi:hypothetical protein POX_h09394 [Penicillium oxalicum]|uniref:Peptidase M6-like domain-containing protein n=1 Tax=Penicillium oxalicum (strain 114-2 / CGMCC 5302) TaxID=933388 RepID=S7ZKC9_PENO1|nr:hypothetical protein POX_h09394 [Penicillium oxalicum]EPS31095.1 hypothetical protein PDE_06050 [Penicillium oxalicum 114-2]KAI2785636.1 hypothetical protein POX_h09394 [Penicillium oxalicum]